jgi:hypothetical protein
MVGEPMRRSVILAAATVTLAAVAITYAVVATRRPAVGGVRLDLRPAQVLFRSNADAGRVASVPLADPGAARVISATACDRFYAAAGTAVCLSIQPGALPTTDAVILGQQGANQFTTETRRIHLAGIPSRARISASGRMVSWTVFVQGDSYNAGGFSTWTGILDARTGYAIINIENIQLYLDGKRYHSPDVNYWGVTFAADDNRFYATVSTKGRTYLVEGDYGKWEARVLRENVECPSLSPDGSRLVFKKRVSTGADNPWRLYVLDLATMRETPLAEPASVDDQAAWLDDRTVMYARPAGSGAVDVWAVAADGSGAPRLLIPDASSPAIVR